MRMWMWEPHMGLRCPAHSATVAINVYRLGHMEGHVVQCKLSMQRLYEARYKRCWVQTEIYSVARHQRLETGCTNNVTLLNDKSLRRRATARSLEASECRDLHVVCSTTHLRSTEDTITSTSRHSATYSLRTCIVELQPVSLRAASVPRKVFLQFPF